MSKFFSPCFTYLLLFCLLQSCTGCTAPRAAASSAMSPNDARQVLQMCCCLKAMLLMGWQRGFPETLYRHIKNEISNRCITLQRNDSGVVEGPEPQPFTRLGWGI